MRRRQERRNDDGGVAGRRAGEGGGGKGRKREDGEMRPYRCEHGDRVADQEDVPALK